MNSQLNVISPMTILTDTHPREPIVHEPRPEIDLEQDSNDKHNFLAISSLIRQTFAPESNRASIFNLDIKTGMESNVSATPKCI